MDFMIAVSLSVHVYVILFHNNFKNYGLNFPKT